MLLGSASAPALFKCFEAHVSEPGARKAGAVAEQGTVKEMTEAWQMISDRGLLKFESGLSRLLLS